MFELAQAPTSYSDWGAIGGIIGRCMKSYWDVPTLMTNSAKLVNIIGGYGCDPALATMTACVNSAVAGRILP